MGGADLVTRQDRSAPFMRSMNGVFSLLPRFYLWEVPTEVRAGHGVPCPYAEKARRAGRARLLSPTEVPGGAPTTVRGKQAPPL